MKLNHLKVNGFGKIKNKEIDFKDGINIIYGKNESGKSTLMKFISSMLYGISRNKNGKSIPDFEKYSPWKTEEYSGTIDYQLDNGESFSIYREFRRKNPIVYNSFKEDITKKYEEDKNGINFFEMQTGIDEETYWNTAISEQTGLDLSTKSQNSLTQRISNFVSTGDDNISYQKWLANLVKSQNEVIGTERTTSKPLNIVNAKIEETSTKLKELEDLRRSNSNQNLDNEKLSFRLKSNEKKLMFLKKVKEFYENNRVKLAEINFNANAALEDTNRIEEIKKELEELSEPEEKPKKLNKLPYFILISVFIIISIVIFAIFKLHLLSLIALVPLVGAIISLIVMIVKMNHLKNGSAKELFSQKNKLKFELDTLKEKNFIKEKELKEKNEKIELEIDTEKDILVNQFLKVLDINFIDEILDKSYEEVLNQIELYENKVSDIKLEMKELEIEKRNYQQKMEELAKIEEELSMALEEKEELLSFNHSYELAKQCLEEAYEETKKNISPKFTNYLHEIVTNISLGKYVFIVY